MNALVLYARSSPKLKPRNGGINLVDFHLMFQVAAVIHVRELESKGLRCVSCRRNVTCEECKVKDTIQKHYRYIQRQTSF